MGASMELEPCVKGSVAGHVLMDAFGMVQGLSQLANLPDPPTDAIQTLLSSLQFEQTDESGTSRNREKLNGKRKTPEKVNTYQCELCPRSYVSTGNLKRHVEKHHPVKRKRLVVTEVYECEECEYMGASQAALETHLKKHNNSAEKTKSPRSKCAFCDKERVGIYDHYISKHRIEYPEQIMFDNGNVLVHSSINPEKGKAPWFLKEKEKMSLYTDVTCRLCEAETTFNNREFLETHYVTTHMVDPNMLENLKHVFRAEKGAHLIDLPASQPPKRRQSDIRTPIRKKVSIEGNEDERGSKVNSKNDRASEPELSGRFPCQECVQVYTTEALLNKHKSEIHAPKTGNKTKHEKYPCCLCSKYVVGIYKHYGNVHIIDNPEQILFNNGNVLVRTDIDTKCGQAPWFISQKEKAENKYTPNTCRLCEADFSGADVSLDTHYLKGHKIDQDAWKRLDNLRCMFRAENRAHLADLPTSITKAKPQRRASSFQSTSHPGNYESKRKSGPKAELDSKAGEREQNVSGLIIYQCAECGVAATTCDASIEHAQLHHFPSYRPISQTCSVCQFSFEAQCFADHSSNHLNNNEYKIVKFHPSKLLDNWSDMFEGLSETHADRIKSSSTYQHTRQVKMNSNMASGIPLYKCGKCELYVRPKEVEGHCHNNICMDNQTPGHFCSDCDIYFFTSVALTEHEKDHKDYGPDCFRTVTFNCMQDELINRALQNIQKNSNSKETSRDITESQQRNSGKEITILEDTVVSVFCDYCKKYIIYSEFEAHAAIHKQSADSSQCEENQRTEEPSSVESNVPGHTGEVVPQSDVNDEENQITEEVSQERNNVETNVEGYNSDITPQDVNNRVTNGGGTVEPWNSDTDSYNSQLAPVSSFDVRVEVHVQKHEDNDTYHFELQDILDEFSEGMGSNLKHDIQLLRLEVCGDSMTYIPDENIDEDLLDGKSESTENGETSDDSQGQGINDKDRSIETTENQKENELNSNNNKTNDANENANESNDNDDIVIEIIDDTDSDDDDDEIEFQADHRESGAKPSSRAILSRMLASPKKNKI
ncbi:uncharacterized protein LOC134677388 [Cydia fagiglandana]|uniref:uncharacterized protein LOC134677388 n=1 Tax=Cydia fagiglandana TaxID=1458189 RepID=UPI002FEE5890